MHCECKTSCAREGLGWLVVGVGVGWLVGVRGVVAVVHGWCGRLVGWVLVGAGGAWCGLWGHKKLWGIKNAPAGWPGHFGLVGWCG